MPQPKMSEASRRYWEAMNNSVLSQAINQLLLPFRVARKGVGIGEDALANAAAAAIGAKRPNPEARSMAQDQDLDQSFKAWGDSLSDIGAKAKAAGTGIRSGIMGALGWENAGPVQPRDVTQTDPMPGPAVTRFTPKDLGPAEGGALDMGIGMGGQTRQMLGLEGPPAQSPGGALSTRATVNKAPAGAPPAAPVAGPPEPPLYSPSALADEYQKRAGAIPTKVDRRLTQQDKGRALMQLGLSMMASGSKPGSSFLGALGEGGQVAMKDVTAAEERNRAQDAADIARRTAALNQEFNVRSADEGRKLGAAQLEETRRGRMSNESIARDRNAVARERNNLLSAQIAQGNFQVLDTGNGYVLFNKSDPTNVVPLVGKDGKQIISSDSKLPKEIQIMKYLNDHPEEEAKFRSLYPAKGALTDKDIGTMATGMVGKEVALLPPGSNVGALVKQRVKDVREGLGVGAPPPALPAGIPAGSKALGPGTDPDTGKKGTVYLLPNGKRKIVLE